MTIIDLSREAAPPDLLVDAVIIGSGSGGAIAARNLAKAGWDIVVIDEGSNRSGASLTQRDGTMYDQLYMDRGGRATTDLSISVLQARVLGGGGVINAADVVPMHEGVLDLWHRQFGLSDISEVSLAAARETVLADLQASRPKADELNTNNQLLAAGTAEMGWLGEIMMHNRVGCTGLGTCLIGCPIDAKRHVGQSAIPQAISLGARIMCRARAMLIRNGHDEIKEVVVEPLDVDGYRPTGQFSIRARHVVVAANAVNTPSILQRSGLGNAMVGSNLMLQPQLPLLAVFDQPVRAFEGMPQNFAVTQFEENHHAKHGWWGFRIEAIAGTIGITSTLLPFIGHEGKEWMVRTAQIGGCLLLCPDSASGRVRSLSNGRTMIEYQINDELRIRLRDAIEAAAQIWFAAGARQVLVPTSPPLLLQSPKDFDSIAGLGFQPASSPFLSAHQMGTTRMSANPNEGAVSPDGSLFGANGIWIMDTSVFPSSPSSHTMTPVMTLAQHLSSQLAHQHRP